MCIPLPPLKLVKRQGKIKKEHEPKKHIAFNRNLLEKGTAHFKDLRKSKYIPKKKETFFEKLVEIFT